MFTRSDMKLLMYSYVFISLCTFTARVLLDNRLSSRCRRRRYTRNIIIYTDVVPSRYAGRPGDAHCNTITLYFV